MEVVFTSEHEELRQTVRRFMQAQSTEQTVRRLMETDSGYDARTWERMASELSLIGLAAPEKFGGAGYTAIELGIVMEEMGRELFCGPYLSTAVLATSALLRCADDAAKSRLLPAIASGKTIATVAIAEENGRYDIGAIAMRAARDGAKWRLDGVKNYVLDGHCADVVLVAARTDRGVGLFEVEGKAANFSRASLPTLDLTRKLARLTFNGTPATLISGDSDATAALNHVVAVGSAMLAVEQVGGAQRCLEMSVDYAKTRLQFGRPIGSFQAIKHKCADMLVETEFARSAAYHAIFCAAGDDENELQMASHMARSYCSEAYFRATADNIQIHGGMGFTWEHPAHLYFKRARASSILFGDPIEHRQELGALLAL
ncbi:MAG: acyl-CoA dehydrogenase family protein [Candidatus Binatus sp.]|uniref:acyl-CoA dehydrogenase family protein n=1 Tax=Candidatus Binatus sp. TaxID=2811406 RepID=UPI0027272E6C|nr:acyl-CoA dehydrogenase family protein [Candidatus Binatus sp.]MDO8433295.1 acyl-CoA dehydrogenase family protein [Candidatus Binatus sp.]